MWNSLLERMIVKLVKTGQLAVTMPGGKTISAGDGSGPDVAIRLADPALPRKLILNPELALGEAYMDETLVIERGDLTALLTLLIRNNTGGNHLWLQRIAKAARMLKRGLDQLNPRDRAQRNARHHYDLSLDFYDMWIGHDRLYTCGYFRDPANGLDQAQSDKMDHLARKLLIKPGMRVLDIGCGFGGLSIKLARDHGARVVGVNLSEFQIEIARQRAAEEGVSHLVEFRVCDYREVDESFDRIVAVGMLEHVGEPHYEAFIGQYARLLAPDGVAMIHYIGRSTPPAALSPWFQKYIFPGGYAPAFSEVIRRIEQSGLIMTDLEILRGHYERTLRHWRAGFEDNLDAVRAHYDERFIRMWRYYLIASELSFTEMQHQVFQVQLAKREDAVPMTREYLYAPQQEPALQAAE